MIIDSHQHFWIYNSKKHAWIDDEMASIRKDFLPEDLKPIYQQNEVDACVAVQADQTNAETNFLLQLANENDFIKGIVGWIDLRSRKIVAELESYQAQPKIKGWRHIVQGEADVNFLLRSDFLNGIAQLEQFEYTYDILVYPHQLGAVLEFVKKFPNQRFVIDHLAKPYIKDGFFDGWAILMKEIAKNENVYCKLSGMITEANYTNWSEKQLKPYIDLVMEAFDAKRVMYGSDWPVCLVAGTYTQVIDIVRNYIGYLDECDQQRIMGKNAQEFYNL
ncbi:amidohydrolase [Euzebyella marina]|uniref:Amidohydrolase n=1 Tax=Euzebyella marina TaxID=1761453 RepID=A0A3G2L6S8_9FLAO|nr:amidohydrolase family protein [Euzebyella marina]AYN67955.1 amidohydrolase [Euzebyella marina]